MAKGDIAGRPVLVLEHDAHIAHDISQLLDDMGFSPVICLRDGDAANGYIEELNRARNDVAAFPMMVVLNLKHPSPGIGAMHALRHGSATKAMPVVMLADDEDEFALLRDFTTGAVSCIARPISPEKLALAARRLGCSVGGNNHFE